MSGPKIISSHNFGYFKITLFLSRFGDRVWMVDDTSMADDDPCGVGKEIYQGDCKGARKVLRAMWGR